MRIISGKFKGRQLHPPKGLPVRPTTDFAREALFNILSNRFYLDSISAIDLFAGTGAISLELASRGCNDIISVDSHYGCVNYIRSMALELGITGIRPVKDDVFRFLKSCAYKADLIFADPPYALDQLKALPDLVQERSLLKPEGSFVLEHPREHDFSEHPGFEEHRNYGNVNFSIFKPL